MAYQPKSYRKFVAGTVTAAVVASAVAPIASAATFPDVSSTDVHAPAINELTEKGIIKGLPNGTFNPTGDVTRGQVAIMFARILPGEGKAEQVFTDVPVTANPELVAAAYEVKSAGVMTGANGYLYPSNNLTRQQMAKVLVEAFDLKATGAAVNLKDLDQADSSFREYISILAQNGVTVVADGNYRPTEKVSRAQFATFVSRAMKLVDTEVKVDGVSATNSTTLTVTGSNLDDLTAADITVADNTVASYTATADGKTATVKLEDELVVDEVTKVTVKDSSFDVTYKVEASTVEVADGQTYDDDTEDQFVKIVVDGKAVTTQELINAGYNVEFEAFTSKAATTQANIFDAAGAATAATSTTGELAAPIALTNIADDYYVKVTVTSGSDVMTSAIEKITIKNINISADNITGAVLSNLKTGAEQTSSTLVTGDTAEFAEITVKSASNTETVEKGDFTVKSSDASVVSVNKTDNVFTAQGPGTATLTITYGGTTYTKTITVKNEVRKATSVKVNKTAVTVTEGGTATAKVQLLDQYGDPMDFVAGTDLKVVSSDEDIAAEDTFANPTGAKFESTLTIDGVDKGSAIFTFRNAADAKLGTTSVKVTVTDNAAIANYTLTVDNDISSGDVSTINADNSLTLTKNDISTDATIDTGDDRYMKINIKGLNSAGQEVVSSPDDTNYEVSSVNSSAVDVLDTSFGTDGAKVNDGYILVKAGTEAGTATITVRDLETPTVTKTIKVTVTDVGITVTDVNFKNVAAPTYATTLDVKDFLSYTNSANDLIITGLTLSKSVSQAIRLDASGSILYIDKDGDGDFTGADTEVGSLVISTTGTLQNNVGNPDRTDVITGLDVKSGDDGTVIFKVLNTGKDKVVSNDDQVVETKAVSVDF